MVYEVIKGVTMPMLGTVIGSACVFFMKDGSAKYLENILCGLSAGIMVAASVFSLLLPSLERSRHMGVLCFVPCVVGFMLGVLFVLATDVFIDHFTCDRMPCREKKHGNDKTVTILAIALHNVPEGMAVGIVYAGIMSGQSDVGFGFAASLAVGIAIQNIPEGAIISLPLKATGMSRLKAFFYGILSAIAELLGAILAFFATSCVAGGMPYVLSFAAGTMMYAVAAELLPSAAKSLPMHRKSHASYMGSLFFALGFCLMMALDTAFG